MKSMARGPPLKRSSGNGAPQPAQVSSDIGRLQPACTNLPRSMIRALWITARNCQGDDVAAIAGVVQCQRRCFPNPESSAESPATPGILAPPWTSRVSVTFMPTNCAPCRSRAAALLCHVERGDLSLCDTRGSARWAPPGTAASTDDRGYLSPPIVPARRGKLGPLAAGQTTVTGPASRCDL
jgi:hypothetical protein